MLKKTIDQTGYIADKVLVVDCELIFDVKWKWFRKIYLLKETTPVVVRYIGRQADNYDRIFIVCIDNFKYREKVLKELNMYFDLIKMEDETNYKSWLWTVMPFMHICSQKRELYHSSSVTVENI